MALATERIFFRVRGRTKREEYEKKLVIKGEPSVNSQNIFLAFRWAHFIVSEFAFCFRLSSQILLPISEYDFYEGENIRGLSISFKMVLIFGIIWEFRLKTNILFCL